MEDMEEDYIVTHPDDEDTGAPVTPRGASGEIEGDRLDKIQSMPQPETEYFVVMPLAPESEKEIVLRPIPGAAWACFPGRETARDIARTQSEASRDFAFGIYGPYVSEEAAGVGQLWLHPRSTPCDTYEMREVVRRTTYYPRGHEQAGEVKNKETHWICNHVDFGFVDISTKVIEDMEVAFIQGSLLTSYLDVEGNLIHPNVHLLARPPTERNIADKNYGGMYKTVQSNQRDNISKVVDEEFRKCLPRIMDSKFAPEGIPFEIHSDVDGVLYEGVQPYQDGKVAHGFAHILRCAIVTFFGRANEIHLAKRNSKVIVFRLGDTDQTPPAVL